MKVWLPRLGQEIYGRSFIGSDAAIILAIVFHLFEATILIVTRDADHSVGVATLLAVFRDPWFLSAALYVVAIAAGFGQWGYSLRPATRLLLLIPQQTIFLMTGAGAVMTIFGLTEAYEITKPWPYVACNQMPRVIMPIIYSMAMLDKVRAH